MVSVLKVNIESSIFFSKKIIKDFRLKKKEVLSLFTIFLSIGLLVKSSGFTFFSYDKIVRPNLSLTNSLALKL